MLAIVIRLKAEHYQLHVTCELIVYKWHVKNRTWALRSKHAQPI